VEAVTSPGEVVCLTGSCPQLGGWNPDKVVPMVLTQAGTDNENVWSVEMRIADGIDVKYRYAVCVFVQDSVSKDTRVVVRRWETALKTRKIICHDVYNGDEEKAAEKFGFIPHQMNENRATVQRGWLVNETLVQLKLHGRNSLQIWKKKHQNKDFYLKVTPVETSKAGGGGGGPAASFESTGGSFDIQEDSVDISQTREERKVWPIVEVARATDAEDSRLKFQSQFGTLYQENSFTLFQAQVLNPDTVAFLIDVFASPKRKEDGNEPASSEQQQLPPPEHIGSTYVMPEHFKSTEGREKKPIISKRFQHIGQFTVDYLLVKPIKAAKQEGQGRQNANDQRPSPSKLCNFKATYSKYWKPNWKGLEVAHRGLGNSYTMAQHCSNVRENTIASMKHAVAAGADMVEFDVQVSKDLVPVIYHEFDLCASMARKKGGDHHLVEMPLKSLTLEQLQNLKTHHPTEQKSGVKVFGNEGLSDEDHQPFPTLEHALKAVDRHAGFNIELKWDMELEDGRREAHNAFELNLFVDTILDTVLAHGNKRKIVFSSFNPDICTVVRFKQNKYPVLFLTSGASAKYDKYHDRRTHSIPDGTNFATTSGILGINVIAEEIQRDPGQVELIKDRGQVLFCWTDDQNNPSIVRYLKDLGVDGIIYDRIDVNSVKPVKQSIFLIENDDLEDEDDAAMGGGDKTNSQLNKCSCTPPRDTKSPGKPSSPESHASEQDMNPAGRGVSESTDDTDVESPSTAAAAAINFSGMFNKVIC